MKQVTVKIRFISPCLGNVRRDDYDRFERDADGNVIFMNSWWTKLLEYGARAYGKHQGLVGQVKIHPRVVGCVQRLQRYYGPNQFKEHEAFLAREYATIRAILPDGLPEDEFLELLSLAGEFRGISPYGWRDGYGRFEVIRHTENAANVMKAAPDELRGGGRRSEAE